MLLRVEDRSLAENRAQSDQSLGDTRACAGKDGIESAGPPVSIGGIGSSDHGLSFGGQIPHRVPGSASDLAGRGKLLIQGDFAKVFRRQ